MSLPATQRAAATDQSAHCVFVVDDDVSVRDGLKLLIGGAGYQVVAYASPQEFLAHPPLSAASCLILDVNLPEMNGLELQAQMLQSDKEMPIIFITGYADVPNTVQAMKAGAIEFLTKPFAERALLEAIQQGLQRSRRMRQDAIELGSLRRRYASLTPREREVMTLVVSGLLNKQIAAETGVVEQTIKARRGRVMRKMQAGSLADLVRIAAKLQGSVGSPTSGVV